MSAPQFTLTDEERELLPSPEDVEFYAEHGWYLSKKLFTDAELDALTSASDRFYAGERDRILPVRPPRLAYWEPEKGDIQRHNDYVQYEHNEIRSILSKPLVGAVAALLAQTHEIRMFQATMIYKPPIAGETSNIVPWHFDKHYWATCTSEKMLTAFIPFHDCTEHMGTITMADGSHLWKELGNDDSTTQHFAARDNSELETLLERNAEYNNAEVRKVPVEIPRGHISFHHCKTYHASGFNLSDRPRRSIAMHLQDGDNAYRPFALTDGSPVVYNHDVLVRTTDAGQPDYSDPDYCPVTWRASAA